MANPQLEDGYTRIANEILEAVYSSDLNGTQLKILLCIWRFTYGFQRKGYELSKAFISKAIGRHRSQVGAEIQNLIDRKIIRVEKEATFTESRVLAFNKNFDEWDHKVEQVLNPVPPVEPDTTPGIEISTTPGTKFSTQEKKVLKKDIKEKNKEKEIVSKDTIRSTDVQLITEAWNSIGITKITGIKPETTRYRMLKARIREYGTDQVLQAVENIGKSSFLKGNNDRGWEIRFDWFIKPNNFLKVLEGNYADKGSQAAGNVWEEWRNEQE